MVSPSLPPPCLLLISSLPPPYHLPTTSLPPPSLLLTTSLPPPYHLPTSSLPPPPPPPPPRPLPTAILRPNDEGELPLHVAIKVCLNSRRSTKPLLVVRTLLDACPESAKREMSDDYDDGDRMMPLHFVMMFAGGGGEGPNQELIRMLLACDPSAASRVNPAHEQLPLHDAIETRYPLATVKALLSANPQATSERSTGGYNDPPPTSTNPHRPTLTTLNTLYRKKHPLSPIAYHR